MVVEAISEAPWITVIKIHIFTGRGHGLRIKRGGMSPPRVVIDGEVHITGSEEDTVLVVGEMWRIGAGSRSSFEREAPASLHALLKTGASDPLLNLQRFGPELPLPAPTFHYPSDLSGAYVAVQVEE